MAEKSIIDEYMHQATVPFFNYMGKQPDQFKNMQFQQGNALDLMF